MNIDAVFEICKGLRNENMNAEEIEIAEWIVKHTPKHLDKWIVAQAYLDLQKKQEGVVLVPKDELSKLETARVDLYELLVEHLGEKTLLKFTNITGQIWKVANTKNWNIKP